MSRLLPYQFRGGLAVVTGAASGIGEQLAKQLAIRGCNLHLVDRDETRLAAVADRIARNNPAVTARIAIFDLEAIENLSELAEDVIKNGSPTLLVNNAGVALGGQFHQLTLEEFDWVLRVNFRAAVGLTHHLLPALIRSPGSHVVNVSSAYGLVTPRGQSAYVASTFALRGFSDVLRLELFDHGVGVTTVYPGGVRTRIAANSRRAARVPIQEFEAGRDWVAARLTYPPERAAAEILAAVQRRRPRVLITQTAHFLDLIARLAPAGQAKALERIFGRDRHRRPPRHTAFSIDRAPGHRDADPQ
jgi:short-subunit dehydrogenase